MGHSKNNALKLVLITNSIHTKFEAGIINRLFSEGLDELHLRKEKYEKKDHIKFLDKIDADYHSKVVLHDCYSLVHDYDIRKIHVSRKWRSNIATEFILNNIVLRGKKVEKSICVHSCNELYRQTFGVDEIMLGPVFSKSTYTINNQLIKSEDLARANRHSKAPVLGLGGVTLQTIDTFKDAGFAGVVLQSGIWRNADPVRAFIQMRDMANSTAQPMRIAI